MSSVQQPWTKAVRRGSADFGGSWKDKLTNPCPTRGKSGRRTAPATPLSGPPRGERAAAGGRRQHERPARSRDLSGRAAAGRRGGSRLLLLLGWRCAHGSASDVPGHLF
ncbi:unnamed protein product [Prorocentrum cordatum]|uniref:Uncharacterized protein n=1 Tax=Prorocentrum cordatum TaxID=2364126 RepID=A0ABN9PEY7_9DINO|nr:unnamed protein product [Polarella glacialis]